MFSLKTIAEALKGEPEDARGETGQEVQSTSRADVGKSLWNVASSLTNSVKQRTVEFAATIQETDWRSELTAFQQGFKEETTEIGEHAKVVTEDLGHKAKHVAEKLPGVVEHLPGQAGQLIQTGAQGAKTQIQHATKSISSLSHRVVHGASGLFDQISNAIQDEMAAQDPTFARMASNSSSNLNSAPAGRYSRFEADVAAMQRDSSTYCDEPEDTEQYEAFLADFNLGSKKPDIEELIAQNTFMSELQSRIVPLIVEYDVFWTRYFYRLHKLEQKHQQFVQLTQRAEQANTEEEGIGWDDSDVEEAEMVENAAGNTSAIQDAANAAVVTSVGAVIAEEDVQQEETDQVLAAQSQEEPLLEEQEAAESQPFKDDKIFVASTASDNSEQTSGSNEPWCVVEEKPKDTVIEQTEEAGKLQEEDKEQEPALTRVRSTAEEKDEEATASEQEGMEEEVAVEQTDDPFESVEGGDGVDEDLDWGDDVAEWE